MSNRLASPLFLTMVLVAGSCAYAQMPGPPHQIEPQQMIGELKSLIGDNKDYVRITGMIPAKCQDSLSVEYTCNTKDSTLLFTFGEATQPGFRCLFENQVDCTKQVEKCVSIERLQNTRISSQSLKTKCQDFSMDKVKVGFSIKPPSMRMPPPTADRQQTEASICATCAAEATAKTLAPQDQSANEMVRAVTPDNRPSPTSLAQAQDTVEQRKHLARVKTRMINKIKSAKCELPSDDDDLGIDMADLDDQGSSQREDRPSRPGGRPGPGGPDGRPGAMPDSDSQEYRTLFAGHLEHLDDIEDAIEEKRVKCEQQASAQAKKRARQQQSSSQNRMMGMGSMGYGSGIMGMGSMGYGSGMMGMGSMGYGSGMMGMGSMGYGSGMMGMGSMGYGSGMMGMGSMGYGSGMMGMGSMGYGSSSYMNMMRSPQWLNGYSTVGLSTSR